MILIINVGTSFTERAIAFVSFCCNSSFSSIILLIAFHHFLGSSFSYPFLSISSFKVYDATKYGPIVRMGCGYENYKLLESHMSTIFGGEVDGQDGETLGT